MNVPLTQYSAEVDGADRDWLVAAELPSAIPGLMLLEPDAGTVLTTRPADSRRVEVTASGSARSPGLRLEVDLQTAVAYWHPGLRGGRALPADWAGSSVTSLVQSAPVGALYDAAGVVLLGWAASEAVGELSIQIGVSEERKSFLIDIRPVRALDADLVVVFDGTHSPLADTIRGLAEWLSARGPGIALVPPAIAMLPVYSTWYTFTQDINADLVCAEAALAAEIGCGSVFIDDGWQRLAHGRGYQGCGDWLPDTAKFADLAETVDTIHRCSTGVGLWVAPLLLGQHSEVFPGLRVFAPHALAELHCHVLDPRFAEVREWVAETCLRLVRDYRIDLLKIDFLDQAMVYRDSPGGGDMADVGQAMAAMLTHVRRRLVDAGYGSVCFEFVSRMSARLPRDSQRYCAPTTVLPTAS